MSMTKIFLIVAGVIAVIVAAYLATALIIASWIFEAVGRGGGF